MDDPKEKTKDTGADISYLSVDIREKDEEDREYV